MRYADRKRHLILRGKRARCGANLNGKEYLIFTVSKGMKFRDMVFKFNVCAMCVKSLMAHMRRLNAKKKDAS